MAEWELNYDLKIRVNLSPLALNVVKQDMVTFKAKSRAQFLNRVFLNSYLQAEASIARQLAQAEQHYSFLLKDIKMSDTQQKAVIGKLLKELKDTLVAKHTAYGKAHDTFHHTFSTENAEIIESETVCQESEYYTISQYFKAIIEEYCRKPIIEREKIYFKEYFTLMQRAIDNETQLEVCTNSNSRLLVHPFRIMPDPVSSAHYLSGYSRKPKQNIESKTQCSFRISNLKSVRETGHKAFLSKEEKKSIESAINKQGVQFLVGEAKDICVKFTPKGIQKLNRHNTLRPEYTGPSADGIYTFKCTEAQAEYYFLRLGADVEILSPARLRNKFIRIHNQAAKIYEEKNN